MELGTYQAVKDVAMRLGKSSWMLMDGDKLEVIEIDDARKKALWRKDWPNGKSSFDWMEFSRFAKCFKKVTSA